VGKLIGDPLAANCLHIVLFIQEASSYLDILALIGNYNDVVEE
jgi:hypothetical protein